MNDTLVTLIEDQQKYIVKLETLLCELEADFAEVDFKLAGMQGKIQAIFKKQG